MSTGDINTESLVFTDRDERLNISLNFDTYRLNLKPECAPVTAGGALRTSADNNGSTLSLLTAISAASTLFVGEPVDGVLDVWGLNDFRFCGGFKRINGDDH